jgi:small subunit ribosomal protein S2
MLREASAPVAADVAPAGAEAVAEEMLAASGEEAPAAEETTNA